MNNIVTICIGRELGSGGRLVAKLLSEKLNLNYYDKEIIYHASSESGLSPELFEKADERAYNSIIASFLSNDKLFKIQSEVILRLASEHPSVFVGRCADYILRDKPNVFSIFLTAEKKDRVARLCKDLSVSEQEAESIMEKADRRRQEYYNFYTFKQWGAASSYDLCINTSVFGIEKTVSIIKSIYLSLLAR